ncbi:MAG TPA: M15 family metallopeptidase [Gemmatimonadaceae bacterium]|jgi:hypothetical protein
MTDFKLFAGLRKELVEMAIAHRAAVEAQLRIPLVFTSGRRSPEEQMALYVRGRAIENGVWVVTDPHLVVTNALPDHDPHVVGAAYDCAPAPGHRIDWQRIDLFEKVGRLAPVGLTWGGSWPRLRDLGHFELSGWRHLPPQDPIPMA